jgi:hypothetical protein
MYLKNFHPAYVARKKSEARGFVEDACEVLSLKCLRLHRHPLSFGEATRAQMPLVGEGLKDHFRGAWLLLPFL